MCDHPASPLIRRDELVRVFFIRSHLNRPLHEMNLPDLRLQSNPLEAVRSTLGMCREDRKEDFQGGYDFD